MSELTWEAPGPGAWELDTTHASRSWSPFMHEAFKDGFVRGFQHGTARYGLMLSHLEPGIVNGFFYDQPRAFGAPPGAPPPPPDVLEQLTREHPEIVARLAEGPRAFSEKRWRQDLEEWDNVDKPAAIEKHSAIQAIDVRALSDAELAKHITMCWEHLRDSFFLHHKYTVPAVLVTGDLLAGVLQWAGIPGGPVMSLLRGTSEISHGFGAGELAGAAASIRGSESAQKVLASDANPGEILETLAADPEVNAYLDVVRYRCFGYDVGDPCAGEMPEMLVETLRAAVGGAAAAPQDGTAEATMREQIPAEHRADFDDRLTEARLVNRLRDERDAYSDGWATGLARRALLEAGRRLAAKGLLHDSEHAVDATAGEIGALLEGCPVPTADELASRFKFRTTHSTDDAPPFLGGEVPPPPPSELLPEHARRAADAIGIALFNLFGVSEAENEETIIRGLAVNIGTYEGTARVVNSPEEFGRIQQGDVLVARMTSPYFNVVLPLLGALVTDRGGQLSHAAIVAREYGIPGIVGTREATVKIPDGARVRVDGGTGEVHVLG
jgi:pyruvate,water dikinase